MNDNNQNFDSTDLDRLHAAVKREKPDAEPGAEPAPLWVFIASMVAMVFGGGYAGAYVGGFDFEKNTPFVGAAADPRPVKAAEETNLDPMQVAMKKGSSVFNNCQGCHLATGTGQPGLIPPLAGSEWVTGGTERIARVALHGLAGSVTVKGATYNGLMPPHGHLNDKELAQVLTYIRNSWGNKGSLVTPEMIAKVRADTKAHAGQWTAATLEEFKDKDIPGADAAAPAPAK